MATWTQQFSDAWDYFCARLKVMEHLLHPNKVKASIIVEIQDRYDLELRIGFSSGRVLKDFEPFGCCRYAMRKYVDARDVSAALRPPKKFCASADANFQYAQAGRRAQ